MAVLRKILPISLGILGLGFLAFVALKVQAMDASGHDYYSGMFLSNLYPRLVDHKKTHGKWPSKHDLVGLKLKIVSPDGRTMPEDAVEMYWSECSLIESVSTNEIVAYILAKEESLGRRMVNVLYADGRNSRILMQNHPNGTWTIPTKMESEAMDKQSAADAASE